MIAEFIQRVLGEQEGNAVIGLRNKDGAVNIFHWFSYPQEVDKMVSFAEAHTNEDLYYSPILYGDARNEKGKIARTPENALTTQVIYCDADTARPDDFRLAPSIVVQTSAGRFHCYWSLIEPIPASEASEIVHRLTVAHQDQGSDSNTWSANKVLRIPGSKNTSHGGFPEDVKVAYTGEVYDALDVSGAYDDVVLTRRAIMRPVTGVVQPDSLPDYGAALDKLSAKVLDLALAEPRATQDRSKLRYRLLCELFREDSLTFEEAMSIAWHAPASKKWSEQDSRGFSGLLAEAYKAQTEVEDEKDDAAPSPDEDEALDATDIKVSILSAHERMSISHEKTIVDRYVESAGLRVPKQNKPYDVMNGWTWLSAGLCTAGFIPRRNGAEKCNIFGMTLGETTSGKSASRKILLAYLRETFLDDPGFNIGGNPSASALGKKLLERDGMVSFFNKDEAHGALKSWIQADWTSGLLEALADLYDGKVDAQLRTSDWEASGKSAETYFIMHLQGTPKAMIELLNRDLFASGFLVRFVWAIGLPREVTYDSMAEEDSDGEDVRLGFDPEGRQAAAELLIARRELHRVSHSHKAPIRINPDAAKRLQDAKWQLEKMFEKDVNYDILQPSLVRMGVTVRKMATLIAMSEGRNQTTLRDILLALKQAEEWVSNLVNVARQITASDWQRACDEVEKFVASRPNGEEGRARVLRAFKHVEGPKLEMYIQSLISQNRLREFGGDKGKMLAVTVR